MPRPKRPVVDAIQTESEYQEPEEMRLTSLELSQLQLHQVRIQLQLNVIENLKMKMEFLALKYKQDHAVLQGQIKGADDSRAAAQIDYNSQLGEVERRLNVKLSDCIVDDITGIIRLDDKE